MNPNSLGNHLILDFVNVPKSFLDQPSSLSTTLNSILQNLKLTNESFIFSSPPNATVSLFSFILSNGHFKGHLSAKEAILNLELFLWGVGTKDILRKAEEAFCSNFGWENCVTSILLQRGDLTQFFLNDATHTGTVFKKFKFLHQEKTPNHEIRVYDTEELGRALILDGFIQFTQDKKDTFVNTIVKDVIQEDKTYEFVAVIGGGDLALVENLVHKHKNIKNVVLVEFEPKIIAVLEKYFDFGNIFKEDKHLRIENKSLNDFFKQEGRKFDAVFIDLCDVEKNLFTSEVYKKIKESVLEGGFLAQKLQDVSLIQEHEKRMVEECHLQFREKHVRFKKQVLCCFCYEICQNIKETPSSNSLIDPDEEPQCQCSHDDTSSNFFRQNLKYFFQNFNNLTKRKLHLLNLFLNFKSESKTVLELAYPKAVESLFMIQTDLVKHRFKWLNLDLGTIDELVDLLNTLNHPGGEELDGKLLVFLNSETFEAVFPLNFIDNITNYPDNNYGKAIYDKTMDFFTSLLNFFINFYLKKDFYMLEHMHAQEIDTLTPFARERIREKNQSTKFLKNKYFTAFNLTDFVTKIVNKFIIGLSQRWISETHRVHYYGILMCKMLIEYSLLSENESEKIKNVLYQKIQNLKLLEKIIDKEPEEFDVRGITRDFIKIREYYGEFILSLAFLKQDSELIRFFTVVYSNADLKQNVKKTFWGTYVEPINYEDHFGFEDNFFFEKEYSRKSLEIFGYVISQQSIRGQSLISKRSEGYSRNFMYLFSSNNDPYTKSLKLMSDEQYKNYFKYRQQFTQYDVVLESFLKDFLEMVQRMNTKHMFCESLILNEVQSFLQNLMSRLNIKDVSYLREEMTRFHVNTILQFEMCENNFGFIVERILNFYLEEIKQENKEKLLTTLLVLMQYYLIDNCDNQSIFFQESLFSQYFDKMVTVFPHQTVLFLYNVCINFPKIIVRKEFTLEIFLKYHQILFKMFYIDDNSHHSGYITLKRILTIIGLFLKKENIKLFSDTPASDLIIAENLIKFKELLCIEEITTVIVGFKVSKDHRSIDRYDYVMEFLLFLSDNLQSRYTHRTYEILIKLFSLKNLRELINLDKNNLRFRSILIEYFDILHVDIKDHLIDEREKHYREFPKINLYEEDVVINVEGYKNFIWFIIDELNFLATEFHRFEKDELDRKYYYDYVHDGVLGVLAKLTNFFLTLTDANLFHFIGMLKEFKKLEKVCLNHMRAFEKIFQVSFTQENSQNNPLTAIYANHVSLFSEAAPHSQNSRTKLIEIVKVKQKAERGKARLREICQHIFNLCQFLMPLNLLERNKKQLMSRKSYMVRMRRYVSTRTDNDGFIHEVRKKEEKTLSQKAAESENFTFSEYYFASYDLFKKRLSSVDASKNNFLNILLEKTSEAKEICANLCIFYMFQLRPEIWTPRRQKNAFKILKCFINTFFYVTGPMQEHIHKIARKNPEIKKILHNLWEQLRYLMNFVKSKTTLNKIFKEAFENVIVLLKLHQFFCEDNNRKFKDYFRNDEIPHLKHNRLFGLAEMFSKICESNSWHENYDMNRLDLFQAPNRPYLFPLGIANLECISELLTGPCLENQRQIYKLNYDKINGILNRYCKDIDSGFYKLKLALVEMVFTTAEGIDEEIIMFQSTNIEINTINTVMVNSLKQLFNHKRSGGLKKTHEFISDYSLKMEDYKEMIELFENDDEFGDHPLMNLSVKLYFYIRIVADKITKYDLFCKDRLKAMEYYSKHQKIQIKALGEDDLVCFQFLLNISSKVEVVSNKKVFHFHFKKAANHAYLTEESKIKFVDKDAERETPESKLISLLGQVPFFEMEMEMNFQKFKNKKLLFKYFNNTTFQYLEWLTLGIAFLINFIILEDYTERGDPYIYNGSYFSFIMFLSIIECSISVFAVAIWTYLKYEVGYQINKRKYIEEKCDDPANPKLSFLEKLDLRVITGYLKQDRIGSFFIHMMFSILGVKVSNAFFGLELLTIINLSQTLQYVIKSVTAHSGQLLWTLVFGFITMYAYSIFAFVYFYDDFGEGEDSMCNNLSHCFISVLSIAFTNGSGIAGMMSVENYTSGNFMRFYGQMFMSLSFFIFVNVIMMNIIFGVIVDTFGELRDKLEAAKFDKLNICFICGFDRYIFENKKIKFLDHTYKEHNIWDYVNFVIYMNSKTIKDCNGVESTIKKKLEIGDLSWFPMKKAKSLQMDDDDEEQEVEEDEEEIERQKEKKENAEKLQAKLDHLVELMEKQVQVKTQSQTSIPFFEKPSSTKN